MPPETSSPARVLVTGGGGFIGGHLVGGLLSTGAEVGNLDFIPGRHTHPRLIHWPGSFLDPSLVREALVGVDTLYHLAATNFPRESNRDPRRDAEENLIGTLGLLDMAVAAGVRRVIFCSSGGTVYGPTDTVPIAEDHPTSPISAYGIVKLSIEKYLRLYAVQAGIETLSLRLANPYGPHQNIRKAQGALTTFCHRALLDEPIEIWGDGTVERDYIHIDDVTRAMLLAGASPLSGTEINIGSGQGTSLNTLLAEIEAALGRPVRRRYLDGRAFDVPRNHLDIRRAASQLDWQPEVTLRDGICRLLEFFRTL
jgi:UDP-glucose 4-epimerase